MADETVVQSLAVATGLVHSRPPGTSAEATQPSSRPLSSGRRSLVPLNEQDRSRWDRRAIAEGVALVSGALARAPLGPYQLQAAIAAVHDEAPRAEATDWRQILGLYGLLETIAPGPTVTLNRIVAIAMVQGPRPALERLAAAEADPALASHHRLAAVRAHLLEMAGESMAAADLYRLAARQTLSIPERRYLEQRVERLAISPGR